MTHDLVPMDSGPSANEKVKHLRTLAVALDELGVEEARLKTGEYFSRNEKENRTTMAAPGLVLQETADTVTMTFTKPGANTDGVLSDLRHLTQAQRGAVVGRSQPWVSQHEQE
jgi:hypothetical protein